MRVNSNCSWCAQNGPQEPGERTGGTENQWENRNKPDLRTAETGLNTEKSHGDRIQEKTHLLTLGWKFRKERNNDKNDKIKHKNKSGFCYFDNPQSKMKESEKVEKYLDLARELNTWNTRVTSITIVIGALTTVLNGLDRSLEDWEFRGRIETQQTTALLLLYCHLQHHNDTINKQTSEDSL